MPELKTNILITMAGNGDRFRRAGYALPKFKIEVFGRTLFRWALMSLENFFPQQGEVLFAARPEHEPDEFIAREAAALGIARYRVVPFDRVTDGQATTALLAGEHFEDPSLPVLIYNIDTYVEPAYLPAAEAHGCGWIPCFPGDGEGWSFARAGEDGTVAELAEKRRISPDATIGLYWFRSFQLYRDSYQRHFSNGGTAHGERYIAPLYNTLISMHGGVHLSRIPKQAVHPLGTPEEVRVFRP